MSLHLLYPLNEILGSERIELGQREIPARAVPRPYRDLLVHEHDMTSTLETFHGEPMALQILARRVTGDKLFREVILYGKQSGRPVEFGAIEIDLSRFSATARAQILEGRRPLGGILDDEKIAFRSRPARYFELRSDAEIERALRLPSTGRLIGRQNVLSDLEGRPLAWVVEILPPLLGAWTPRFENREEIAAHQLVELRRLLVALVPENRFWAPKLRMASLGPEISSLKELKRLPTTSKDDLVRDQEDHPPWGTNLTYPPERYVRLCQTSGTSGGRPLRWLDTQESWRWMLGTWLRVFEVAGVGRHDRFFFPFSFGPFLGFWAAWDAAAELGCLCMPGGGMGTKARLQTLVDGASTAICATPTYALHLAETAHREGLGRDLKVEKIFVAGEPGGAVPAVRERLTELWNGADVYDHHGMTEIGPVSFPNPRFPGVLHINEASYWAEVVDPETDKDVAPGETGELILTTLGRTGSPILRYRTGDLVCLSARSPEELGFPETALEGGILARRDDMVIIRGVNLYPSAVEEILRRDAEVLEYRVEWSAGGASGMGEMRVLVEPVPACGDAGALKTRLAEALRTAFNLRVPVEIAEAESLPRFELKARRWIRRTE